MGFQEKPLFDRHVSFSFLLVCSCVDRYCLYACRVTPSHITRTALYWLIPTPSPIRTRVLEQYRTHKHNMSKIFIALVCVFIACVTLHSVSVEARRPKDVHVDVRDVKMKAKDLNPDGTPQEGTRV
jgi:hypothetical protein